MCVIVTCKVYVEDGRARMPMAKLDAEGSLSLSTALTRRHVTDAHTYTLCKQKRPKIPILQKLTKPQNQTSIKTTTMFEI